MPHVRIVEALTPLVGPKLAGELVADFRKLRTDVATKTLERASPGKFVETFVQCLQQMAVGRFDDQPSVDQYLDRVAPNQLSLPESLRITSARIARSIYAIRSKRNIVHKAELDPSLIDLTYAHHAAVWILAELVRLSTDTSMDEAGRLIAYLHAPIGDLVEDIGGVRLVHGAPTVKAEVLILMHSHYPDVVQLGDVKATLSRRGGSTAANMMRQLEKAKLIHGDVKAGYVLTSAGFRAAVNEVDWALAAAA